MKRHHKIIIGSFSTLVIISLIVIATLLNGIIVKQNLENAALKEQISKLQTSTDDKINEIASEVIKTKKSLGDEIINLNENIDSTNEQLLKIQTEAGVDFSGVINEVMGSVVIIRTFSSQG